MRIDTPAKLRLWREGRGLTQATAAQLLRVGHRTYRGWENGETTIPGPAQLAAELMAMDDDQQVLGA